MAPWKHIAGRRRAGSPQVGHTGVQHPLRDSEPDEEGQYWERTEREGLRKEECRKATAEMEKMDEVGET